MVELLTFVCTDLDLVRTDLFYFLFLFFNLKLPIMPFSYFVIQFNIKTFGKNYDLIIRLVNIIVHCMNELVLRGL